MFTTVKLAKTSFTSHKYCVGVVILRVFKIYSQQLSGHLYSFVTGQYSHQQQFVKKCFSFLIGLPCLAPLLKISLLIGAFFFFYQLSNYIKSLVVVLFFNPCSIQNSLIFNLYHFTWRKWADSNGWDREAWILFFEVK